MDVFVEHIVKKQNSTSDYVKKALILIAAFLAGLFVLTFFSALGLFPIGFMAALGCFIGGIYLLNGTNIEYEYIVTNGEIDIDKIIARRSRKRLITIHVKTFEEFGIYDREKVDASDCDSTLIATDGTNVDSYYAILKHSKYGRTLVIFSPDERVIDAIKPFLPGPLRGRV
ncbi:MAG: hypothetical protein GX967_05735 [Clostridiales bacterium]|nr:hypothetical protein [Clostridiales bacterium]